MGHGDSNGLSYPREMVSDTGSRSVHFLLIPHPSTPHITPMVNLAEQLVGQDGVCCTILLFEQWVEKLIAGQELIDGIQLLGLPRDLAGFSTKPGTWPFLAAAQELEFATKKHFERLLKEQATGEQKALAPAYTCVIGDLLLGFASEIADILNIPRYTLSASSACSTVPLFDLVHVNFVKDESKWKQEGLSVPTHPGVPKYTAENIQGVLDNEDYHRPVMQSLAQAAGTLVNTCQELEDHALDAIRSMGFNVIPVGPFQSVVYTKRPSITVEEAVDDECLQWLEKQPANSVLYVNFGTTGFNMFTTSMVNDLALGLEASNVRFLFVFRPPPMVKPEDYDQLLPNGFEERVKDRALVLRGWAPQLKVLEHSSVAAFLNQCGWNSIVEAAARGVPFVGWPGHPEQLLNGRYVAEVTKIGLQLPHKASERAVTQDDVVKAIRTVMSSEEGNVMKRNAEKVKVAIANAIQPGGSSHQNILDFVRSFRALSV